MGTKGSSVAKFLETKYREYHQPGFISDDPISIPHRFTASQDIEIAGFFAAILAWGNRKSIIKSCDRLLMLMGNEPYQFVLDHSEDDLKAMQHFKHRTFQPTDLLYFLSFLKFHYSRFQSLQEAFLLAPETMEARLDAFHDYFFSLDYAPARTRKHIAAPRRKSTCKRINMFLRWMVRDDGIDFGIWKSISKSELICPFDVHVGRVARRLGLVQRKQNDWKAVMELMGHLREMDPTDPTRYDYALFGLGVETRSGSILT